VQARKIFDSLHYLNILTKLDDGTHGWPEYGPYDAIIVTAGGPKVPLPLLEQLKDPGILIIPVGDRGVQDLRLVTKKDGEISEKTIELVRFVNLIGDHGWKND
jgi:protein-L-isoaspartate(D-aspartate) O-methyltransferase